MKIGHDSGQCGHEAENVNKTFGLLRERKVKKCSWIGLAVNWPEIAIALIDLIPSAFSEHSLFFGEFLEKRVVVKRLPIPRA